MSRTSSTNERQSLQVGTPFPSLLPSVCRLHGKGSPVKMPTYADEMAARNPQNVSSRGPVRIWISSGEVVRGPDGRLRLEERWEEEEIMDTDVLTSVDSEPGKTINGRQTSLAATIRRNLADCTRAGQVPSGGSLLVLDTYVGVERKW